MLLLPRIVSSIVYRLIYKIPLTITLTVIALLLTIFIFSQKTHALDATTIPSINYTTITDDAGQLAWYADINPAITDLISDGRSTISVISGSTADGNKHCTTYVSLTSSPINVEFYWTGSFHEVRFNGNFYFYQTPNNYCAIPPLNNHATNSTTGTSTQRSLGPSGTYAKIYGFFGATDDVTFTYSAEYTANPAWPTPQGADVLSVPSSLLPVDVCNNITGNQSEIPSGMEDDGDGGCAIVESGGGGGTPPAPTFGTREAQILAFIISTLLGVTIVRQFRWRGTS